MPNICMQKGRCSQPPKLPFVNETINLFAFLVDPKEMSPQIGSFKIKVDIYYSFLLNLTLAPHKSSLPCVAACPIKTLRRGLTNKRWAQQYKGMWRKDKINKKWFCIIHRRCHIIKAWTKMKFFSESEKVILTIH